ncbi:uncharacterized protein [Phaseolus vulgaris]|uniref:uncharacterized protein isoform X1 n=1 Tax=Phaseolus vulgaris TaxID=3885 RepID=UPI0035CCA947
MAGTVTTLTLTPPRWRRRHHYRPIPRSFSCRMHPRLRGLGLFRNAVVDSTRGVVSQSNQLNVSPWDDKPFRILPSGKKAYLDEQDVVTFIDPPMGLIPLDSSSYNPAAYLWKKIEDIPEERRHRLLRLLNPRLVSMAWQIAGTRYEDPKLVRKSASTLLSSSNNGDVVVEYYNCRTSGGPMPISWINSFRKAVFSFKDGEAYGRIISGSLLAAFADSFSPLYFAVRQLKEVMSTEQPCDLAYEFGDGLYDIKELPLGFPKPGPGVSVGQAWQEGTKLEQVPRKLCGEILMVKDYTSLREDK